MVAYVDGDVTNRRRCCPTTPRTTSATRQRLMSVTSPAPTRSILRLPTTSCKEQSRGSGALATPAHRAFLSPSHRTINSRPLRHHPPSLHRNDGGDDDSARAAAVHRIGGACTSARGRCPAYRPGRDVGQRAVLGAGAPGHPGPIGAPGDPNPNHCTTSTDFPCKWIFLASGWPTGSPLKSLANHQTSHSSSLPTEPARLFRR